MRVLLPWDNHNSKAGNNEEEELEYDTSSSSSSDEGDSTDFEDVVEDGAEGAVEAQEKKEELVASDSAPPPTKSSPRVFAGEEPGAAAAAAAAAAEAGVALAAAAPGHRPSSSIPSPTAPSAPTKQSKKRGIDQLTVSSAPPLAARAAPPHAAPAPPPPPPHLPQQTKPQPSSSPPSGLRSNRRTSSTGSAGSTGSCPREAPEGAASSGRTPPPPPCDSKPAARPTPSARVVPGASMAAGGRAAAARKPQPPPPHHGHGAFAAHRMRGRDPDDDEDHLDLDNGDPTSHADAKEGGGAAADDDDNDNPASSPSFFVYENEPPPLHSSHVRIVGSQLSTAGGAAVLTLTSHHHHPASEGETAAAKAAATTRASSHPHHDNDGGSARANESGPAARPNVNGGGANHKRFEDLLFDGNDLIDPLDEAFVKGLKSRGLEVVEQEGDGNCLFRAVALQVYGDAEAHPDVREQVCDFMAKDPAHFGPFVVVVDESFDSYVARKRLDGVHGNNPELHAVCELFNRPIEVYTPESGWMKPINTFQDQYKTGDIPIRLSYHDGNHYNAVVNPLEPTAGLGLGLPGLRPGLADKLQLSRAKAESDAAQDEAELRRAVQESEREYGRSMDDDYQRALKESAFSMDNMYQDKALLLSDLDATNFELEQTVLEDSMLAFAAEQGRKQRARIFAGSAAASAAGTPASRGRRRGREDDSFYLDGFGGTHVATPHASLVPAAASSASASSGAATTAAAYPPTAVAESPCAAPLDRGSRRGTGSGMDATEYPESVQELVMNGFELSKVVHAYELIGDSFDDMLIFLASQQPHPS